MGDEVHALAKALPTADGSLAVRDPLVGDEVGAITEAPPALGAGVRVTRQCGGGSRRYLQQKKVHSDTSSVERVLP